jgi:uncharacterized protein (DUF1778 family)
MDFLGMDLKLLRLYQITKFLSDFPQESLGAEDADFMKLLFAPLVLAGQPSGKWIEKLDTPDRASYWAEFSRHFYWIAKCWVSSTTFQDDPLRPLLKAGLISRNKYNTIWLSQKMFERLWSVCQHTEPFVREVFEQAELEYPFPNSGNLFAQVVGEMANAEIATVFKPYVECSRLKREKVLKLQAKVYTGARLRDHEKATIKAHNAQLEETPLTQLVLGAARKAARKELIIKHALEDYHTAWARLLKVYATEWHNKGSHAWNHGHLVKGSESGTYPSIP